MKKSIGLFATVFVLTALLASCASTKIALSEHSPAAVISIIGTPDIPWYSDDPEEDSDSGFLTNIVNNTFNSQNPELLTAIDRLDYADDSIRHILPELAGCEILEKDSVLSSNVYKKIRASYFNTLTPTKNATNYKDLSTIGAKNARLLMRDTGAKSLIIMDFSFYKKRLSKTACIGLVTMKIKVLNDRGTEIINKVYTAETEKQIEIFDGDYDKDVLVTALNGAIDDALKQFAVEFMNDGASQPEQTAEQTEEMNKYAVQIKMPAKRTETTPPSTEPNETAAPKTE